MKHLARGLLAAICMATDVLGDASANVGTARTFPLKTANVSESSMSRRDLLLSTRSEVSMILVEQVVSGGKVVLADGSASSSTTGTALVNQDGSDISYYIEVKAGTQSSNSSALNDTTTYNLIVDTGSFYTWVYSQDCSTTQCSTHTRFDSGQSETLELTGSNFSISYTSGAVSGKVANDMMGFAGFLSPQYFGLAETIDSTFANFPIDGIMGLPAGDRDPDNFPGVVNTLLKQGLIEDRVFGVNLARAQDQNDEGSFTLGGIDSAKYTGDLAYYPVVSNSVFWEIAVAGTFMNGSEVDFGEGARRTAIIDTGTTLIIMAPSDALKLHAYISGSQTDGSNFVVPCNTTLELSFSFTTNSSRNSQWTVGPADYIGGIYDENNGLCISNIQGIQFDDNRMILGDVFLKNVYSVYDMDQQVVGFANKSLGSTEVTPDSSFVLFNRTATTPNQSDASGSASSSSPAASSTTASASSPSSSSSASLSFTPSSWALCTLVALWAVLET